MGSVATASTLLSSQTVSVEQKKCWRLTCLALDMFRNLNTVPWRRLEIQYGGGVHGLHIHEQVPHR